MVAPLVEELADEYGPKVKFVKVNTDESLNTAASYGIRSIPTLIVFKGGQPVGQVIGFRPKNDIKREIDKALAS
jgi:thioredoxin 1